ncbi:MAG: HPr family phosphocarrier protein, partial [Deltaproteobacteria bacterium]|nr:HPr family phosphocarrier protein [Deltaproteobacteria bacterium]
MVKLWNSGLLKDGTLFKIYHRAAFCNLSDIKISQYPVFQFSSDPPFHSGAKHQSLSFMSNSESALCREATIINELGLHARSAAKIAKLTQAATGLVW